MIKIDDTSEEHRLETLRRYEILDSPQEASFDRITRLVTAVLNVPIAAVTLVDEDRQWFKSQQGLGISETPRSQSFCAHTMLKPGPMIVEDAQTDPRFASNPLVTGDPNIRFYVGIPLHARDGTPLGALCGIDSTPRQIDARELAILQELAELTCEQLELHVVATLDSLTGAMRRGAFVAAMEREVVRSRRTGRPLSCLMIDVDHFKDFNDRFGHAVGDEVLKSIVAACKSIIRASDFVGRLGGDEFGVVLPESDEGAAFEIGERVRQAIAKVEIPQIGSGFGISASIGVSALGASDPNASGLLMRTDNALYEAKVSRNTVVSSFSGSAVRQAS